ncbi:ATP-binding protein [Acidimicrobiia bacterium EGI L10123]|uniref:ATP-binding protein n=1 Tax=Salinilacustrithrix flava TaxID=2957203 RepID=UPI003D7C2533|nr:ATP-binding protein [Acidimicrobiia bacterium EGI L10123]
MTTSHVRDSADDAFVTSFPARPDALVRARRSFTAWLGRRTGSEVVGELEIVFSELGANAVDASPKETDEVLGRAWCDGSDLFLDLVNHTDPTVSEVPRWDLADPLRPGGRGLMIAEAFVDSMEITKEPGQRMFVRCRRRLK